MQIGAVFPQIEIGADRGGVRAYAEAVQELGFEHILAYDHVLGADRAGYPGWQGPYDHDSLFHEIFVLFGFIAGVAPGLELVSGVVILPQRQTVLVAKQAAEVDVLTGGKFRLGIGIGWNHVEYEGLGMSFKDRARRYEEQIDLLRRLFAERSFTYRGAHHSITSAGLLPLPVQQRLPIWIGGSAAPAIRRAARLADGFFPLRPIEDKTMPETIALLRGWLVEEGRDPDAFGLEPRLSVLDKKPDEWRAEAEMWRALGATHLSIDTMRAGLLGVDAHIARLAEAKAAIAD